MRIVKNDGLSSYRGVTHEYINIPPNNLPIDINKNDLFILDLGDGGSKVGKFERDIKLLLNGIEAEPKNERYHFYLANSYFDLGRFDEAINSYKNRIQFGGWEQEVWFSYYKIGLSYKHKNIMEYAISWWLDAYNFFPKRIENLYQIIEHYRVIGKHKLAYIFYKMAKDVLEKLKPGEKDHYLFLQNDIYVYKLEYELSIISCYLGINNIKNSAMCIFNNSNDPNTIRCTLSNLKFYNDILTPIKVISFDNSINHKIANKNRGFNSSSASLINSNNGGYLMNVRYVNYIYDSEGVSRNCDDHIITINKRIELTKDFSIINEKLIDSLSDVRRYIGIEDVKIFKNTNGSNNVIFLGTGLNDNANLCVRYGVYNTCTAFMESIELKCLFNDSICEKNWVLYTSNDNKLNIVYKWYPLQLCDIQINEKNGTITLKEEKPMPKIFSHIRGSTHGYSYGDEIWFIVHMVSYEKPRYYYHLIVVFDKDMNLLKYSHPIKFEGICIEFCLGILVEKNRVIISYSTWDRTTKLGIYDKKYIDNILCLW